MLDKKSLSERDICTKFITPALKKAGWDEGTQFLEEVTFNTFTDGRIYVKGNLTSRGVSKRADYILYYKPNIPIAIIEAKDNKHTLGAGMQQALNYGNILQIPFVFSSNGDGFLFHDPSNEEAIEKELDLNSFPSPYDLWVKYKKLKGIETEEQERIVLQEYYFDGSNRKVRYYQQIAINRTIEAIAKGQNRILLVMATGTGKTYTAFQIAYRLWKAGVKKRILFLADRNALIDQTKSGDFKYFQNRMTVIKHRKIDKSYEVYFALYQGLSGNTDEKDVYKEFSPEFFDLIIVDECHRGSANEDSAWREILEYFSGATQIGLTATPKETEETSNIEYFGQPVYVYSLKQGIEDGFLAPYQVLKVNLNVDLEGWRPEKGKRDKYGNFIEDRIYNSLDYDKSLVIDERTQVVAKKITEYLKVNNRFAKTIVFCSDIEHAERMRSTLASLNSDLVKKNHKYVMRITGDDEEGKKELWNFISPEEKYPVIACTSELMTTGVDTQTCQIIVLEANIQSMTKFKQIIGRGTRIKEDFGKTFFTIIDFRHATDLFADPDFDGEPVKIKEIEENDEIVPEEILEETILDEETGEEIVFEPPTIRNPFSKPTHIPSQKIYVNGVDVSILNEREIEYGSDGKQVKNLKDYTKNILTSKYPSLESFLNVWNQAEKKAAIIEELKNQDVYVEELIEAVNNECDLFDLVCHIAYDQPPLTRKERANNVKKRNYFTKYGEKAKRVLEALLDKYADKGIEDIENLRILQVKPFDEMGSPTEIIQEFGGREQYLKALKELEDQLYQIA